MFGEIAFSVFLPNFVTQRLESPPAELDCNLVL